MRSNSFVPKVNEKKVRLPAEPDVVEAFIAVDYSLEAAVNDLVDNSLDAQASTVLVRFFRDESTLTAIEVIDNGVGMTETDIDRAMTFGGRRKYSSSDLGMFGMGLKSASLSQADVVSVMTRSQSPSSMSGRQWFVEDAKTTWDCGVIPQKETLRYLDRVSNAEIDLRSHGTIIRLDSVRDFIRSTGSVDKYVARTFSALKMHLGRNLHRLLECGDVTLGLDVLNESSGESSPIEWIKPIDPFKYPKSGASGYPKTFKVEVPKIGIVPVVAHIWPKKSTAIEYKLGGSVAHRQGFYFYRNNRLIQAGGWNGVRDDAEPHLSLARVVIDLPPKSIDYFKVRFTKAGVQTPQTFISAVQNSESKDGFFFEDYIKKAQSVYRSKEKAKVKPLAEPRGLTNSAKKAMRNTFEFTDEEPIALKWQRLPMNEFFRVDDAKRRLILNSKIREQLEKRDSRDLAIDLLETAVFLLMEEHFRSKRVSSLEDQSRDFLSKVLSAVALGR